MPKPLTIIYYAGEPREGATCHYTTEPLQVEEMVGFQWLMAGNFCVPLSRVVQVTDEHGEPLPEWDRCDLRFPRDQ